MVASSIYISCTNRHSVLINNNVIRTNINTDIKLEKDIHDFVIDIGVLYSNIPICNTYLSNT